MIQRPSGDQSGEEWYVSPYVSSSAAPLARSTRQMDPAIATATDRPSGAHDGAHGVELGDGGK